MENSKVILSQSNRNEFGEPEEVLQIGPIRCDLIFNERSNNVQERVIDSQNYDIKIIIQHHRIRSDIETLMSNDTRFIVDDVKYKSIVVKTHKTFQGKPKAYEVKLFRED